jgi:SAM-dependent methyltransferase
MAQGSSDVFRTGEYYKRFKNKNRHTHLLRQAQLRRFYRTAAHYVRTLGWPDPLAKEAPSLLLCGTASPYTTVTFTRFVRTINSKAAIAVLDIASYALSQSKTFLATCRDVDLTHISFIEGDALSLPCTDEQFDGIETDFFIQYFSSKEKVTLFQEWYRTLKPGGIVTTRDWLLVRENFLEHAVDRTKNWLIRHVLGPIACSARLQDVQTTLHAIGFEVAFFPVKIPFINCKIPLMYHILIHKPLKEKALRQRHQ